MTIRIGYNGCMTITFDLPPEVADRLDQKAAQEGQDMAVYLRQMALREAEAVGNGAAGESRIPGLHKGQYWITDDFDAPLPESFWLGIDFSTVAERADEDRKRYNPAGDRDEKLYTADCD